MIATKGVITLKKIKMLTKGPNGNHKIGSEIEVDDVRAKNLIKGKHAKAIKDER